MSRNQFSAITRRISHPLYSFLDEFKVQKVFYNVRYYPQNNPIERVNRTVLASISAYINQNQREWDVHLHKIALAIRLSAHQAIWASPSFLTFRRLVPTAGNFYCPVSADPDLCLNACPLKFMSVRLKTLFQFMLSLGEVETNPRSKRQTLQYAKTLLKVWSRWPCLEEKFCQVQRGWTFLCKACTQNLFHRRHGNLVYNIVRPELFYIKLLSGEGF